MSFRVFYVTIYIEKELTLYIERELETLTKVLSFRGKIIIIINHFFTKYLITINL